MEARCGVKAKELAANYKLAASISREVLTLLEEQPKRVEVLNNLYHYCCPVTCSLKSWSGRSEVVV